MKSCRLVSTLDSLQVNIMLLLLMWMTLVSCQTGSSEDLLKPFKDVMTALEGDAVTLSCKYSGSVDSLFWYQQKSRSSPQLLMAEYSEKTEKLTYKHNKTSKDFHLQISSAAASDSAVYYCAVRLNDGWNKIYFGTGTNVIVVAGDESEPSYYKLQDSSSNLRVCLATGFSRQNATDDHQAFKDLNSKNHSAVQISGGSGLFSKVALITPDVTCGTDDEKETCPDILTPDPKVNFLTLILLGLRLLFLKTVVFNVLMTVRLWMSR